MYSYGPPHMAEQKQDDQLEHIYSSYVKIWNVALKTCLRRWTLGKSSERGAGISVLSARDDDDDDEVLLYITKNSIKHQSFVYTQLNVQFYFNQFNLTLVICLPTV